jgi:signal transduction histidine kinase
MTHLTAQDCPLAVALGERLRDSRQELATRWLERIADRVAIEPNKIFPTDELLDHVPMLIEGIANYLQDPGSEVGADTPVVAKAMELGALRHAQGFDVYQILKEYEILGGILFAFLAKAADEIPEPCEKSELLFCGQRLFKAVTLIQQATTMHYLRLADGRVAEREERLRAFNRSVSHEIKNQIGTVLGASDTLLEIPNIEPDRLKQFIGIIAKNARMMRHTIENLVALSRTETDARQHRHVLLPDAAREAARQVRETSEEAGVQIRHGELPAIEVNAAAVELCLINYLSNAIKYADPKQAERFVEITGAIEPAPTGGREIVIRVRDNGIGVSLEGRDQLFHRFFRARDLTVAPSEGTGLGLSIVSETVQSLGGRAWAEFPERGSIFAFSLPFRREDTVDTHGGQTLATQRR